MVAVEEVPAFQLFQNKSGVHIGVRVADVVLIEKWVCIAPGPERKLCHACVLHLHRNGVRQKVLVLGGMEAVRRAVEHPSANPPPEPEYLA